MMYNYVLSYLALYKVDEISSNFPAATLLMLTHQCMGQWAILHNDFYL